MTPHNLMLVQAAPPVHLPSSLMRASPRGGGEVVVGSQDLGNLTLGIGVHQRMGGLRGDSSC